MLTWWREQRVYICVILGVGRWQKQKDALLGMETCCVWVCIHMVLAAFGLAWARLHRERIWQACLLSPQNNCLRITWGKSRWRYLEMTLPGDFLNHVHIRLGCYFACIRVCVFSCVVIQADMLSPSKGLAHDPWYTMQTHTPKSSISDYISG